MFKTFLLSSAMTASALLSTATLASDISEDIESLQNMSYTSGQWDEGEVQVKQRRCAADGSYQDGKYRSFLTYATGAPSVVYNEQADEYYVYHSYSCRTRTRLVTACSGVQTNTDDTDYSGTVKVTLSVTRRGKIKVLPTRTELGGHELCGASLANDIIKKLDDSNI